MPPLVIQRLEAVAQHGVTQHHAVVELLAGEGGYRLPEVEGLGIATTIVGVALDAEPVEGAAHVNLLTCLHIDNGEVNGRATGVATLGGDIFTVKDLFLGQAGIEVGLGNGVTLIQGPAHEVVHAALGTIGVIDLDAIAVTPEVVARGTQAVGSLTGHQRHGLLIAVDPCTHKVVGAEIADFEDGIGDDIGNVDKLARIHRRILDFSHILGTLATRQQASHNNQGNCHHHLGVSHLGYQLLNDSAKVQ